MQMQQPYAALQTSRLASSLQAGPGPSSDSVQEGSFSVMQQQLSEPELDLLWGSIPRALLKLGKSGAQDSHARSLMELLPAHKMVKVQLNGNPRGAQEIGRRLATMANATLLGVQGSHMLFALASCPPDQLLELAQNSKKKQAAYHQKRLQARLEAESAQPGGQDQQQESRGPKGKAASSSRGSSNSERGTGINKLISEVSSNKGGMSRKALQMEWENLEKSIYESEVSEAETKAQQSRSGSRKGASEPILEEEARKGGGQLMVRGHTGATSHRPFWVQVIFYWI
eukprot:CAMPEP_0202368126 /NCGR_PEP_ID=MMETSP1127-20130417/314_1 /ASSEMBLY_ACC=CAM_ASM_000462 /TAXON_ID=3047 /ORGANISM="Dunaliella tertiolecta, Strain CCMP1320" /LENGTH=284 /DNA_ID=CAMNT_0048963485 /DNA_START=137 /DNA_END=992 /DNA_ORIENTATION=+